VHPIDGTVPPTSPELRAETAQALRNGDLPAPDHSGLTLRERFPQREPKADAHVPEAAQPGAPASLNDGRSGNAVER
jgi:hypothetical protein